MAIGSAIERMDDRKAALLAALKTALEPSRVVTGAYTHLRRQTEADLTKAVVTLMSAGERNYNAGLGMTAKEGTQRFLAVVHLKVAADDTAEDVEALEFDILEEIKAFVRSGVSGMSLRLDSVQHSRQQDHPYGWAVAYLDAGPPRSNTH